VNVSGDFKVQNGKSFIQMHEAWVQRVRFEEEKQSWLQYFLYSNIRQLGTYQKSCKPESNKSMVVMDPAAELYQKLAFLFLLPIADQLPLCTL
jgi:hypothetical protein